MTVQSTLARAAQAFKPSSIQLPSSSNGTTSSNGVSGESDGPTSHAPGLSRMRSFGQRKPKTPQDEAVAFFSGSGTADGETSVQVWELWLEDDGGPGGDKSVSSSRSFCRRYAESETLTDG